MGSVLVLPTSPSQIPGFTVLSPAYPERGFEHDPRRTRAFPVLDVERVKTRMTEAGFAIDVDAGNSSNGRKWFQVGGWRGGCRGTVVYFQERTAAEAATRAAEMGSTAAWEYPTMSHQTRAVQTIGADTSVAASRKCSDELFALVTK